MDWREYIQEKESITGPATGHAALLLKAMHDRPGATATDAELAAPRLQAAYALAEAILKDPVKKLSHMGFSEYRSIKEFRKALAK